MVIQLRRWRRIAVLRSPFERLNRFSIDKGPRVRLGFLPASISLPGRLATSEASGAA
jgi:hypothetical protein